MPRFSSLAVASVPLLFLFLLQLWSPTILSNVTGALRSVVQKPTLRSKTPILMAATPAFSHMEKITTIAEGLIGLGYPVSFISGLEFKDYIESIGAEFVQIEGSGPGMLSDEEMATFVTLGGDELEIFATKAIFIDKIPAQYRTLQRTFTDIKQKYGEDTKLILLQDCSFGGLTPVMYGAPGTRPAASISIGLAPYPIASNDTFPFRSGRQPDTSPDAQIIHFEAQKQQYEHPIDKVVNEALNFVLKDMGAVQTTPSIYDMFGLASDIYLQYGVPAFEYQRSDIRPNLQFMGAPVSVGIAERALPEWWDDVLEARKAGKHIVAITSSSVVFDNNALVIPALEALSTRTDVLVIATLVTSDVDNLSIKIPDNARVAKFIPLDLAFPYVRISFLHKLPHTYAAQVSVLISNGGYGTVQQALRAGIPMIFSGVGQDKLHTGALIEWSGVGIYHAVPQVTSAMVSDAFEKILSNESYRYVEPHSISLWQRWLHFLVLVRLTTRREKSKAMAEQFEQYNAIEVVDSTIQKVLRGDYA